MATVLLIAAGVLKHRTACDLLPARFAVQLNLAEGTLAGLRLRNANFSPLHHT